MATPCTITYEGKEYSIAEFAAQLHDGLLDALIESKDVTLAKESGFDKAIDFLENLKADNKNKLNAFGILPEVWNAAISGLQAALKAGKSVTEALDGFIKELKDKGQTFDEKQVRDVVQGAIEKGMQTKPKTTEKVEGKEKTRKLSERILESEKVEEGIKEAVKKEGTTYLPINLNANQEEAQAYVDKMASMDKLDEAMKVVMDLTNGIKGVTRGHIGLALFDKYSKLSRDAESKTEKQKYDLKAAKVARFSAEQFTSAGQEINAAKAWKKLLSNSPEGAIAELTNRYEEVNRPILNKEKDNIRDAKKDIEELLSTEEGKAIIEEKVEQEIEKRLEKLIGKEQKKKISDFFDSLLINNKGKLFDASYALPVAIYNGAIKAMKSAALLGADAANIVKAGVDYVSKNHKGDWLQKDFELDMNKSVKKLVPRKKADLSEKYKKQILDKWAERLKNIKPEQRQRLLAKSIQEINDVGGLSDERFEQFYAEAMGLKTMTEEAKQDIFDLITSINDIEKKWEAYQGLNKEEKSTPYQRKYAKEQYLKSIRAARKANDKLSEYFRGEKEIWQTLTTIMQGNLLTPASLIQNLWSNIALQPIRFLSNGVADMMDYSLSQLAKHTILGKWVSENRNFDTIERTKGYFNGLVVGSKEGWQDTLEGLTSEELKERDLANKMKPLQSAADLWANVWGKKDMSTNQKLNAFAEMTMGIPADAMFRLLNLGDKPFRRAAELGRAFEIAKLKGLKGRALEEFLLRPDEESAEKIKEAGDKATFQQDSAISQWVTQGMNKIKDIPWLGKPLFYVSKTLIPFVKTPTNVIGETMNLVLPPIPLLKSIYYAKEGDRKRALEYFGQSIVATMLVSIAVKMIANGLVSGGGDDDDKKERAIQYENVPPNSLNISALTRGLSGQGFKQHDDDVWVNHSRLGIFGSVLGTYASMMGDEPLNKINDLSALDVLLKGAPSVLKSSFEQSFLKGTSAIMEAITKGGNSSDRLIVNVVNAISSTAYPNTLAAISRASDPYMRDISADNLGDEIKNMFKQKMFMSESLPARVTLWGEKVTTAPEGRNRYIYTLFDISKAKSVDTNNFGYKLYEKWRDTKDSDWLPSVPKNTFTINGKAYTLTPSQYEEYAKWIGSERKRLVEMYVSAWDGDTDDMKQTKLTALYSAGKDLGQMMYLNAHPEILKQ